MRLEAQAVMLCARATLGPEERARLRRTWSEPSFPWQRFWDAAADQQVLPLVTRALLEHADSVPDSAVKAARALRLQTMAYNLALDAELNLIGRAMHARGIPVAPLKGTHMAARAYGALDARQVGDVDILVPEHHLTDARSVLQELGYAREETSADEDEHTFHGAPFVKQGAGAKVVVELHWGLNNPRFVTIDYERLWQRIIAESAGTGALSPLPTEETLLFLAVHLAKHRRGLLRLLADVDRLVRREGDQVNWDYLIALADRWSATGLLYFALARSQTHFDTPIPAASLLALRPAWWRRLAVSFVVGTGVVLRPVGSEAVREHRSWLAYCAMLRPFRRSLDAYLHYYYPEARASAQIHPLRRTAVMELRLRRAARGAVWTGRALVSALCERDSALHAASIGRGT